jgi:hypothetical protein
MKVFQNGCEFLKKTKICVHKNRRIQLHEEKKHFNYLFDEDLLISPMARNTP